MSFFDTHAHLDYPDFAGDLPEILKRAEAAGITRIISIGTDQESAQRAIELSGQHTMVYAVAGWHPSYASAAPDDVRPWLREAAGNAKVVALGETGLDYHRLPAPETDAARRERESIIRKQKALFQQHLEIAAETGLNCVIHERDAFEDTFSILQEWAGRLRGVFHCYTNTPENLRRILSLGSIVSFTGILTFKNAQTVRDSLAAAPAGSFMLETDCPFLAPIPYRGKRCEPAYVREIAETAAKVKGCSMEDLSKATCDTARGFFGKLR